MKKISALSVSLNASVKPFVSAFSGARSAVTSFTSSVGGAGAAVLRLTGAGAAIGGAFAAIGTLGSGISLAAELESTSMAFETMLGSARAAAAMMGQLKSFASSTPFQFPEIAGAAKSLLNAGVSADMMTAKLRMLGDISAGSGKPLNELVAIFAKIKSVGKLQGDTLAQLAEGQVPIYKALAKQLGVNESAVADMVSKGKVGYAQLDAALAGLTVKGASYYKMTEKQSQGLAGLWSSLTDNISLGVADFVTAVVDAFGLKGALASMVSATGSIGGVLTAAVKSYAPIIKGFAVTAWKAISGAFDRIYATVAPIVTTIWDFIARNWQSILATTTATLTAVWGVVKAVASAVWSGMKTLWTGVVSTWTGALGLLGVKTAETGSTVGNVFQTLVDWGQSLARGITQAMNVASYAVTHWRDVVELAGAQVMLFVARTGSQIEHVFTTVIPTVLKWMADNWLNILTDLSNANAAIFNNMAANIGNFVAAIWSFLKGDEFNFQWTGLLDGFESTLTELPKIMERQMGPVESAFEREAERLGQNFSRGLADSMKGAGSALAKALTPKVPMPEVPKIETPTVGPATNPFAPLTTGLEGVNAVAKEARASLNAIAVGSAQAQLLKYQAGLKYSEAPKAAPVPAAARKDMAESGKQTELLAKSLKVQQALLAKGSPEATAAPTLTTVSF